MLIAGVGLRLNQEDDTVERVDGCLRLMPEDYRICVVEKWLRKGPDSRRADRLGANVWTFKRNLERAYHVLLGALTA